MSFLKEALSKAQANLKIGMRFSEAYLQVRKVPSTFLHRAFGLEPLTKQPEMLSDIFWVINHTEAW